MTGTRIESTVKDRVLLLTMNRPEAMNAYDRQMIGEWEDIVQDLYGRSDLGVVIITGTGKAFCSGADLIERRELSDDEKWRTGIRYKRMLTALEGIPQAVIAAINGYALGGGCELALVCDIRIAAANVKLGVPEAKVGIIPGAGGTQRLPRLVGRGLAKELIFTGRHVLADEALRIGLVERVVEPGSLMNEAWRIAGEISQNAPLAIAFAKQAVNIGSELDITSGLSYEEQGARRLYASEDYLEGLTAFREKRPPRFRGR